jgi:hypothetical protein
MFCNESNESKLWPPKDYNIQNFIFTCCFVWVWNSDSNGRTQRIFQNEELRTLDIGERKQEEDGDTCVLRHLISCTLYYVIKLIQEEGMGGEYSTNFRD